jgi:DNA-binding CsgD family transcriptional regulator
VTARPAGFVSRSDVESVLGFLAVSQELDPEEAYPPELVGHLGDVVPMAHVVYRENDLARRCTARLTDGGGTHIDDADELYWTVGPCAITVYRRRTGDLLSARLSDVATWRGYRETAIYREYFLPGGVDHMLDLGLEIGAGSQRTLLFCRETGDRDFTERDRAVLELLRPHLMAREARADLRRRVLAATTDGRVEIGDAGPSLTPREREIVFLAGAGQTNAQIAAQLWLSPGTVKKHLENVYQKLGVGSRAAAATKVRSQRTAS